MAQEWRVIADHPDYEVSNIGNVRSNKNTFVKILKPGFNRKGYKQVNLCSGGKYKTVSVHRLVALAFVEQVGGKLEVDHIDRDKTNNNVENLRWADRFDQTRNTCRYRADIEETDPKLRRAIFKKEYREANIEKVKEWEKRYRRDNKEQIRANKLEKIQCECGVFVVRCSIARHRKLQKHIKLMENQN